MPTARHGKVRRMLRDGKAHVVRLMPFTIQLDYNSDEKVQEVSLGIDAGSKHIGVSATTKDRELLAMQVEERDDIVKLIASRREARRTRRNRKLRHRAARFDNRRRKKGWLAPSIENRVSSHLRIIRLVNSILPISKTTIEVAQFDMQKIQNDNISGIEYQQGNQLGFWNVREYVLSRDKHTCHNSCVSQALSSFYFQLYFTKVIGFVTSFTEGDKVIGSITTYFTALNVMNIQNWVF